MKTDFSNDFVSFLKKRGLYKKYKTNLYTFRKKFHDDYFFNLTKHERAEHFIVNAFIWDKTEEGFYFWKNANEKWKIHLQLLRLNSQECTVNNTIPWGNC